MIVWRMCSPTCSKKIPIVMQTCGYKTFAKKCINFSNSKMEYSWKISDLI